MAEVQLNVVVNESAAIASLNKIWQEAKKLEAKPIKIKIETSQLDAVKKTVDALTKKTIKIKADVTTANQIKQTIDSFNNLNTSANNAKQSITDIKQAFELFNQALAKGSIGNQSAQIYEQFFTAISASAQNASASIGQLNNSIKTLALYQGQTGQGNAPLNNLLGLPSGSGSNNYYSGATASFNAAAGAANNLANANNNASASFTSLEKAVETPTFFSDFDRRSVIYLGEMNQFAQATDEAQQRVSNLAATIGNYLTNMAIRELRKAFREAFDEMKAVDDELTQIQMVTGKNDQEIDQYEQRSYQQAKRLGTTASEYLSSVTAFTRAGYGDQAEQLGELSTIVEKVGATTQQTATQMLLAVDAAYKYNGSYTDLISVVDGMVGIADHFPTSVEKMSEGLGKVASIASLAHVGVNELTAALGTITSVTQRSGQEAATALRSLFLNIMGDTKTEIEDGVTWTADEINGLRELLKIYAADVVKDAEVTGQVINPMKAIGALAQAYREEKLSEQDLVQFVTDIGGKIRAAQLTTLIQNWDMYEQMLSEYAGGTGETMEKYDVYLDSWTAKTEKLKATWTDFVQQTISSDFAKNFIDGLSSVIEWMGNLGDSLKLIGGLIAIFKADSIVAGILSIGKAISSLFTNISMGVNSLSGIVGIIGLIVTATTAINNTIQKNRKETIQKGSDAAEEAKNISELYLKWKQLREESGDSETTIAARDALVSALKDEGIAVDDLAGKYGDLNTAVGEMTKSELQYAALQAKKGAEEAGKDLLSKEKQMSRISSLKGGDDIFLYPLLRMLGMGPSNAETLDTFLGGQYGSSHSFWLEPEHIVAAYDSMLAEIERVRTEEPTLAATDAYQTLIDVASELSGPVETYRKAVKDADEAQRAYDKSLGIAVDETEELTDATEELKDANTESGQAAEGFEKSLEKLERAKEKAKKIADDARQAVLDDADALVSLQNELAGATAAYEAFSNAKKNEHGGALGDYKDMYGVAKEMFGNGMIGSEQLKAAMNAIFGEGLMESMFDFDYGKAAELAFGDTPVGHFLGAVFGGEGQDYGVNAANFFRDALRGINTELGDISSFIKETPDGGFEILDAEGLAEQLGISEDLLFSMIDAWGMFGGKLNMSKDEADKLVDSLKNAQELNPNGPQYTREGSGGTEVNMSEVAKRLADAGKSAEYIATVQKGLETAGYTLFHIGESGEEIAGGLDSITEFMDKLKADENTINLTIEADTDPAEASYASLVEMIQAGVDMPIRATTDTEGGGEGGGGSSQSATTTVEYKSEGDEAAAKSANKVAEAASDAAGTYTLTFTDNGSASSVTGAANALASAASSADGTYTLTFDIVTNGTVPSIPANAEGTPSAPGGYALVNDQPGGYNPELIVDNGRAYIANRGLPTIVNLGRGATVYTADETRKILKSGMLNGTIPAYWNGTTGAIPTDTPWLTDDGKEGSNGGGGGGGGNGNKGGGGNSGKNKGLLEDLDTYIEDILEKAREAMDEQIQAIDAQLYYLKYQQEITAKTTELEEARAKLLEAEQNLIDANTERTVRYYNEATGQWEWMADQRAILEAQEALAEAQKDEIQAEYDALETVWEALREEIENALENKKEIDIDKLIERMNKSAASGSVEDLLDLLKEVSAFTENPAANVDLTKLSSFDNGGIASGYGFMPKATGENEVVLDGALARSIISPQTSAAFESFTNSLESMFGIANRASGTSLIGGGNTTNNNGGNTYINGVQIGAEMMDRPLSEVLSVLPIYANGR